MRMRNGLLAGVCLALLGLATTPVSAQVFTGRIEVTATDQTGAVLPGVNVEVNGPARRSGVTDARGSAVFMSLPPGAYEVRASLAGFTDYTNPNVPVSAGVSVPLRATLAVSGLAQQVEVTAESPVIDPKKLTTSTNVTNEELQLVPSSRDPWVVLQTVPGVIVDRVNVGGAESGQQSNYQAKGASSGDNTWSMDGVPITDMSALGSSPTYYDFDMFQEMQVVTGGADLTNATPGVALNFVLKGGSNTPHGSSRIYYENEDMQSNNLPDDLKATLGGTTGKGNRIDEYTDYGFELGGPIWRDRLWAWGAYGKTDVTLLTLANTPDQTILENISFKATGQASDAIRGSYTYFRGNKEKFGRSAGPTRPPETTWNQTGPSPVHKGEGNVVVGSRLFLTGRYSYVGGGFQLTPQGGLNTPYYQDDAGVWRGSYAHYETVRPQWAAASEGNFFAGRHEIKFGFGWRRADVDSTTIVPGSDRIVTYHDGYPNMIAEVTVWNDNLSTQGIYQHAYVGDTMTWDRLTLNAGVRWDRQASSVNARSQPGNPSLPDLLPELTGQPAKDAVVWNSVTPRVGISYALDDARKTLLRASYGLFASQLNAGAGNFLSTVGYRGVYFFDVVDANGNRVADPAEFAGLEPGDWYGVDIDNPSNVASPIHSVGEYDTPLTHEVQFGIDRELATNFGVSGTVTWRHFDRFNWRNNGLVGTDYEQIGSLAGTHPATGSYDTPIYGPTTLPANRAATIYRDRPDYYQRYWGFELAATKRLSNRWMARLGFSTNDHREYFTTRAGMGDPTPTPNANLNLGTGPSIDGGLVMRQSTGSGKSGIYQLLPKYQIIATGLYQAPWGINLATNMVVRQGYSMPYFRNQVATADPIAPSKTVLLVDDVADHRLPTVTSLDARVGKEFAFNRLRFNVDLDVFNVLNASTVLGRQYNLRVTTANDVLEIMNPRVLRVGVRFNF
ncbi:MAG TPA: carboxypeptidase regulatory-like domain-containing protein [Vicinamibacterales bacterium]|nr:carboxypeptidase regulatory-like domain-containing protein [Vicinamibacterales bacterium]